jgi:Ca-activated chloride channel family protein
VRYEYFQWDEELFRKLLAYRSLRSLFHYLATLTSGDVEQAFDILEELRRRGALPPGTDLERFRRMLEEEQVIREVDGGPALTPLGLQGLRRDAFDQIFSSLRKRGVGDHPVPQEGSGSEALTETRSFRFGDDLRDLDWNGSIRNYLKRRGPGGFDLGEEDLVVFEKDSQTSCASVLLLDVSHSMVLYGEDRITPAKRVALGLVELIRTSYPRDSIDVVLFGDDARQVPLSELPFVSVGPYHTNTKAGLDLARRILRRKKHTNKQVLMITDGKPSCIDDGGGRLYKNPFGLDPRIVNRTLDEAVLLRRERVPITTFMIARDPSLQRFVERLTELNRGRAFFADSGNLGAFVMVDFVRNRRRRYR